MTGSGVEGLACHYDPGSTLFLITSKHFWYQCLFCFCFGATVGTVGVVVGTIAAGTAVKWDRTAVAMLGSGSWMGTCSAVLASLRSTRLGGLIESIAHGEVMVTFGPDEGTSAIDARDGIGSTEEARTSRHTSLEDMSGSGFVIETGSAGPESGTATSGNGAAVQGTGADVG